MAVRLSTSPYHGYAVQFSPFNGSTLALVGAQNYGIAGSGVLIVYSQDPPPWREVFKLPWTDGLFDVTWSEANDNVLAAGGGDGRILLVDLRNDKGPVGTLQGHTAELASVQWSTSRMEHLLLSAAWDKSVRVWDPVTQQCVSVFPDHTSPFVYKAIWSPHQPGTFISVAGDHTLRLWDANQPIPCCMVVPAHSSEVLTCDWSKYEEFVVVTGGVDRLIKFWDLRNATAPVCVASGHGQAVKNVKFNPHNSSTLVSCSYDFSVRTWTTSATPLETIGHHTEFTYGVDLNLHFPGEVADCSWDGSAFIYKPSSLQTH